MTSCTKAKPTNVLQVRVYRPTRQWHANCEPNANFKCLTLEYIQKTLNAGYVHRETMLLYGSSFRRAENSARTRAVQRASIELPHLCLGTVLPASAPAPSVGDCLTKSQISLCLSMRRAGLSYCAKPTHVLSRSVWPCCSREAMNSKA